jgi:hypothetical protein
VDAKKTPAMRAPTATMAASAIGSAIPSRAVPRAVARVLLLELDMAKSPEVAVAG